MAVENIAQDVLFPEAEEEIARLSARINDCWHITVGQDKDGFFHPGIWRKDFTIAGNERVEPVLTLDRQILKTEEETYDFIENVLKKQELTAFWAKMAEVPKNAFSFLKNPMSNPGRE